MFRNIDVKSERTLTKGLCLYGVSKPYEIKTWAKGKTLIAYKTWCFGRTLRMD